MVMRRELTRGARGGLVVAHWLPVWEVAGLVPLVVMWFPGLGCKALLRARRGMARGVCGECRASGGGAG